ncbi:universal stress protein [Neobacillus notoginsengisoli]|uniref:Universal stress protein n=1 Tax=Neobacillus notoginsengisoli TaxID=1578198 RepID=A0A417YU91_9BACI|nr:universal stress protein [Neobacillus notoginsengisoli]RHW40743.1 universal stress protein [Neobacillus notoginsengisoli]
MANNYQRILVAVDGSKEAELAYRKSLGIAMRNGADLLLIHVIDTRTFAIVEAYDQAVADRADQYAYELLEQYKTQAIDYGLKNVNCLVEFGSPKLRIPKDIAKSQNIDLIVCGATGLNAVERFLIGSVSENITRHAPCDVLIVRSEKEFS